MPGHSELAEALGVSAVLRHRAEVLALRAAGVTVSDLTIGDLDPRAFPVPRELLLSMVEALLGGYTTYPPANGLPELREALAERPGRGPAAQSVSPDRIVVAAGARPLITATLRALVDPGERITFGVPSWNNHAFATLVRGVPVAVPGRREDGFFPAPERLRRLLRTVRVIALNSPLNPTSTLLDRSILEAICRDLLDENARRRRRRQRPVYLLFDGVYGSLALRPGAHLTPLDVAPEAAPFVIEIDAASKALGAATGLRLGWAVLPAPLAERVTTLLGHEGAWAPTFVQKAAAVFLRDAGAVARNRDSMLRGLRARFEALAAGLAGQRARGYPIDFVSPQGGLFMAIHLRVPGLPDEALRRRLLSRSGVALVPFCDFGYAEERGWFRAAVATSTPEQLTALGPRLQRLFDRGPIRRSR